MLVGLSTSRDLDKKHLLSDKVKKQQIIDDVFNNRPPKKGDAGGVKLRLSHLSQVLEHKFRVKLDKLMSENPDIQHAVANIALEEGANDLDPAVKQTRQVRLYYHWLKMKGTSSSASKSLGDSEFAAVEKIDTEHKLKALIEEQQVQKNHFADEVKQSAASYYYLVYPETYSFN